MKTLQEVVHASGEHGGNEIAKDTSYAVTKMIPSNENVMLSNKSLPNIDAPQ